MADVAHSPARGRWPLIAMVAVAVIAAAAYVMWARGAHARAEAVDSALFVPILLTPSVQVGEGQVVLYKATNVSDAPRGVRLMLYNEQDKLPSVTRDFPKIGAGMTISHIHEPPRGQVMLGEVAAEGPLPVRAVFAPMPGDNPGTVRNFVAAAQIVRLRKDGVNTQVVDAPVVVPVEHCTYEPRGFLSHTGGRWYWNCAPQMLPINPRWLYDGIAAR